MGAFFPDWIFLYRHPNIYFFWRVQLTLGGLSDNTQIKETQTTMNLLIFGSLLGSFLALALAPQWAEAQYLGFGGVVGSLSPRTGSSWPPFPGAGQGYWARRAGFYGSTRSSSRPKRSAQYLG